MDRKGKIKVLYLIESLHTGGAEQLLLTTLKYLDRNRFEPVVYCLWTCGKVGVEIEKQLGIKVVSLNKRCRLWRADIVITLVLAFLKERPAILHTNLFYASYFGRIAAILTAVPVRIATEHGTHSNFKKFYHHWIDFSLSFATTGIIAVSDAVKLYLGKYSWIPLAKITVMHNAVDLGAFDRARGMDRSLIRRELGFSESDFIFGCVSSLLPWKGQQFLLEAFQQVAEGYPQARLCLAGRDGIGFREKLESFAQKGKFLDRIYFLGERRDIPEILKACDAFVFPSLTEGLGISLLEAMYMGLPAVASGTEGILEIIENGNDGFLVPPGDSRAIAGKFSLLLEGKENLEKIGFNAREKVRKYFSADNYVKKLEAFYEGLPGR